MEQTDMNYSLTPPLKNYVGSPPHMGNLYKNESKPTHSANMFAIFSEGVNKLQQIVRNFKNNSL